MLVKIDRDRCIGCGVCVQDCVGDNLCIVDGAAQVKGHCILCGHCVAICPTRAVAIPSLDMADVEACVPAETSIDAAVLLHAIKARRSIRAYEPRAVERAKLDMILEAGRYTATAKNSQGCRFIVVQEGLPAFKSLIWTGIQNLLALPPAQRPRWVKLYKPFERDRRREPSSDFLFRTAPAVVFIATDRADDAGLAAQNMELMAASLGLGVLYNGYLCRAAEDTPQAREWLGAGDKPLQLCMLLGYSAVSFARTAPRLPGDFVLK